MAMATELDDASRAAATFTAPSAAWRRRSPRVLDEIVEVTFQRVRQGQELADRRVRHLGVVVAFDGALVDARAARELLLGQPSLPPHAAEPGVEQRDIEARTSPLPSAS
jgi:hypothetical protein